MRKIHAILFDVIGTTVLENDPEVINRCFLNAFEQNSIAITKQEILTVRGKDKYEAIQQLLQRGGYSQTLTEGIFEAFKANVTGEISHFTEHPSFQIVHDHFRAKRVKVGTGSGLPASVFEILFEHLNWSRHRFDYSSVFERFSSGRPDPVMIRDMSAQLNVPVQNILKVGDTVADVQEGKNANSLTAAVASGTQKPELLLAASPDYIFNSLDDIMSII